MKNQYVGDIGDYGKYGLLRFLASHGIKIGVNWYLTENDGSTDGKFTTYLKNPADRVYDPELFDALQNIADHPDKTVKMIKQAGIIPDAEFFGEKQMQGNGTAGCGSIIQHLCWGMPSSYLQILIMASATEKQQGQKTARSLFSRKMLLSITTAEGTSSTIAIKAVENRKPGIRQRKRSEIISEMHNFLLLPVTGVHSVRIYLCCIRIVI